MSSDPWFRQVLEPDLDGSLPRSGTAAIAITASASFSILRRPANFWQEKVLGLSYRPARSSKEFSPRRMRHLLGISNHDLGCLSNGYLSGADPRSNAHDLSVAELSSIGLLPIEAPIARRFFKKFAPASPDGCPWVCVSVGFEPFRDGDRPENPSLEPASQLPSQAGHFHGVANGLCSFVQFKIPSAPSIAFGSCARELGGPGSLSLRLGKPGQAVEDVHVGWVACESELQFAALGRLISALGRKPGVVPMRFGGIEIGGRQVSRSLLNNIHAVGCHGPAQPSTPDRGI